VSSVLRRLFGPTTWRIVGAVAVALLIWFAGPLLAFAQWHPLDPAWARLTLIAIVLLLWFGRRIASSLRAAWRDRKMLDAIAPVATKSAADDAGAELRRRFEQAMQTLRRVRGGGGRLAGRRHVYQLPWYLFVGPPGSGKTTALANSGLRFPLGDANRAEPLQGVGGTRNCQWWFTDEAVLIDTAGRYTTQDSDQAADAAEWQGFLKLLRRFRPRQPINGVLLVVSADSLLAWTPQEASQHAVAVRSRLAELDRNLGLRFPVYLLVTKCDLLAGFTEFFDDLDRERRDQVWGTTFPMDPDRPAPVAADALGPELDALLARLQDRTADRLLHERSLPARAAIFGFPGQFALLRAPLVRFFDEALGPSRFDAPPMVRGVYFTSGTQEGSPIDRLLGTLSRAYGLQSQPLPAQRPSGRSYFVTRLLRDVVFAEGALAGTNLAWEGRLRTAKRVAVAATVLLVVAGTVGWTLSWLNNRSYLAEVDAQVEGASRALAQLRADDPAGLPRLIAALDRVRGLASTPAVPADDPPASHGWGLFQGGKLDDAAQQAYRRLLADGLGPMLSRRIEQMLRQGSTNPELQYLTLKAYVMLHERDRLDPDTLQGWVAFDAETRLRDLLDDGQRAALAGHVRTLFARDSIAPSATLDAALLERVRRGLLAAPFPNRVVNRIKREGLGSGFPDFRIPQAGGNTAQLVLARASGAPITDGVPGAFTYDAYHKGFQKRLDELLRPMAEEEAWVLGVRDSDNARRAADATGRAALADEVRTVYLQEYAALWERFVADVVVRRGASLEESVRTARVLSAPDSPLPRLLRAIVREVTLLEREEPAGAAAAAAGAAKGLVDKAAEAVKSAQDDLRRLAGSSGPTGAPVAPAARRRVEAIVDDRFEALRRFVRAPAPGQPAPIDSTLQLIGDLYTTLVAAETAVRSGLPPPPSELPNRIRADAARLPEPVRGMLTSLTATGANQALSETRSNLSQQLAATVGDFCQRAIGGRYPFTPGSGLDVTPDDFARLFAAGGLLDEFFQKHLAQHVDTGARPWRFRRQGDASMGDASAALAQFQRADEIRRVFFAGGAKTPAFRFELRPAEMDPGILQFSLDVDGQVLRYAHGPVVPMNVAWPGTRGSGQIRIQLSPAPASGASGLVFDGPWALFRMFDRGRIERGPQPERFRVSFDFDGRRVALDVNAGSVQNPFGLRELQAFQCPTRL
jgi:type VI secretion system protein ImpL